MGTHAAKLAGLGLAALVTPLIAGQDPGSVRWRSFRPEAPEVAPGVLQPGHGFYFTRAVYAARGRPRWATDYPKADRQFLIGVSRILPYIDAFPAENPVRLDDPALARFPFLYAVEVGNMSLTEAEVLGLRRWLLAGGFLVVDDFWGTAEWINFERELRRVLPGREIVDLPLDHPLFHTFYDIDAILQVPNVGQGIRGGPTWERDGYEPHCRGIFDDRGRLMVVINWNTDLGDAWEWADDPHYPRRFADFAYKMGINFIVYSTSH